MKHLALLVVLAFTFPLPSDWESMSFRGKFHTISNMMEMFLEETPTCKKADFSIFGIKPNQFAMIKCKEEDNEIPFDCPDGT